MGELIQVTEPVDGVSTLVLDRAGRRNALSIALRDEMSDALERLAVNEACRAVVITGNGDVFSAGFDLGEFADASIAEQLWASSDRWHRTIIEFPLPTVAAVNGPALGGGFDLAVMCDVRVAASSARFAHPEHTFTQIVYAPLHDLVGGAVARDLGLTGRAIDAEEARALRLVSKVVEPDALMAAATETAAAIAEAPREVLLQMKAKIIRRAGIAPGATLDL